MRFEGSLDTFSLSDIITLVATTRKSGALHVTCEGRHGLLRFADGALAGGSSDASRQTLVRRLIGAGLVGDEALSDAVSRVTGTRVGLARALRDDGAVDAQALADVAGEHVVDAVFDLLGWADGDFSFALGEPDPDGLELSWPADQVISEVRRRLEVWEQLGDVAPPPEAVLSLAPVPPDTVPEIGAREWSLLALVDGRRTVAEVAELTGQGVYGVVTGLAALVDQGLVRPEAGDAVASLVRRQQLLGPWEGPLPAPAGEEPPADRVFADELAVDEPAVAGLAVDELAADEIADRQPAAEADAIAAASAGPLAGEGPAAEPGTFTGQDGNTERADDLLMSDMAELVAAVPSQPTGEAAGGGAVPDTLPVDQVPFFASTSTTADGGGEAAGGTSSYPGDAPVSRSLLMRLIAGVQGL
jgi:uncharacterized protein YgfB (UPF0149 family)